MTFNLYIYHLVMTDSSPWKDPPIFKNGKPSISMGHLSHGYVCHNQRVMVFNGIEGWKCRKSLNLPLASALQDTLHTIFGLATLLEVPQRGGFAENGCESHLEVLVLSLGLRIITDLNILNSTRFTCSQTPLVGYSYPQTSALNPI